MMPQILVSMDKKMYIYIYTTIGAPFDPTAGDPTVAYIYTTIVIVH